VGVLVILLLGQAMASMDEEMLVVAAPSLRRDLHTSEAALQLVLAMYTIMFAALVVCGARLGDVVGRRRAFLAGLAGFSLSSLAGGLAPTPTFLVVARGAQGASAALMTPQVLSIIQLRTDGERRARAIGAYSMVLAAGVAAGQVLGGLLVSMRLVGAAWRPALLLNAPAGAALLFGAYRCLPDVARGASRRLDLGGVVLLSSALLALFVPLSLGRGDAPFVEMIRCSTCASYATPELRRASAP
jgi:MFS family permease